MVIFTQVGPGRAFTSSFAPLAWSWAASERARVERGNVGETYCFFFLCMPRSFLSSLQTGGPSRSRCPIVAIEVATGVVGGER